MCRNEIVLIENVSRILPQFAIHVPPCVIYLLTKLFLISICYVLSFTLNDLRLKLLGYCVIKLNFIFTVFVSKVFTAILTPMAFGLPPLILY